MENKIEKQDKASSTQEPRRAVKLNAETLRALEGEDPATIKYGPTVPPVGCTTTCPW
jgi:hypothetical protein